MLMDNSAGDLAVDHDRSGRTSVYLDLGACLGGLPDQFTIEDLPVKNVADFSSGMFAADGELRSVRSDQNRLVEISSDPFRIGIDELCQRFLADTLRTADGGPDCRAFFDEENGKTLLGSGLCSESSPRTSADNQNIVCFLHCSSSTIAPSGQTVEQILHLLLQRVSSTVR